MDPFEVCLAWSQMLKRMTASQQVINKAATFAIKHVDLREEIYRELMDAFHHPSTSVNTTLNLLYLMDALLPLSLKQQTTATSNNSSEDHGTYHHWIGRDLGALMQAAVPDGPKGVVNLRPTLLIVQQWFDKGYFAFNKDYQRVLQDWLDKIQGRLQQEEGPATAMVAERSQGLSGLSHQEILRRMEEDRERHKRVKEGAWLRTYATSGDLDDGEFEDGWANAQPFGRQDEEDVAREMQRWASERHLAVDL